MKPKVTLDLDQYLSQTHNSEKYDRIEKLLEPFEIVEEPTHQPHGPAYRDIISGNYGDLNSAFIRVLKLIK